MTRIVLNHNKNMNLHLNPIVSRRQFLMGMGYQVAHRALAGVLPYFFVDGIGRTGMAAFGSPAEIAPLFKIDLDWHGSEFLDQILSQSNLRQLVAECEAEVGLYELSDEETDHVVFFAAHHITVWVSAAMEEGYDLLGKPS